VCGFSERTSSPQNCLGGSNFKQLDTSLGNQIWCSLPISGSVTSGGNPIGVTFDYVIERGV
jgi:hypothetical protein